MASLAPGAHADTVMGRPWMSHAKPGVLGRKSCSKMLAAQRLSLWILHVVEGAIAEGSYLIDVPREPL